MTASSLLQLGVLPTREVIAQTRMCFGQGTGAIDPLSVAGAGNVRPD